MMLYDAIRIRRGFPLQRLQVPLSAAKVGARVAVV
jgi:hypothetical protein